MGRGRYFGQDQLAPLPSDDMPGAGDLDRRLVVLAFDGFGAVSLKQLRVQIATPELKNQFSNFRACCGHGSQGLQNIELKVWFASLHEAEPKMLAQENNRVPAERNEFWQSSGRLCYLRSVRPDYNHRQAEQQRSIQCQQKITKFSLDKIELAQFLWG